MPLEECEVTNFSAGQIDSRARKDRSKQIYNNGLTTGLNTRILAGGALKRRAGTWKRVTLDGKAVGVEYVAPDGSIFKLVFRHTEVDIFDEDNALVDTLTGAPWGSSIIDVMCFSLDDGKFIVTHTTFWPQVISVDDAGVWSFDDFVFQAGPAGAPAQPYWRYADKGITLQPSAVTGSITLVASDDVFDANHTDTYFRYLGYEILITAVIDPLTATGTIVSTLPKTVIVSVSNGDGFMVDTSCEGLDSGAKGIIVNKAGVVLTIVYTSGLTGFTNGETLVGDNNAQSDIVFGPTDTTPAAVVDWDEQAFSAVRGYPGTCAVHRGRLYFLNMRDLPRGITASAAGFPEYFKIGANDGDAFFELIPDYKGQRALHLITADQGIVLTDKACYYIPEYGTQVVTPSTIDFRLISPVGASPVKPVSTELGFAFVEEGANRVLGILPTGNVQGPWQTQNLTTFWTEQITGPRGLAADIGITSRDERYAYVVNDDGSIACAKYQSVTSDVPIGWTPWTTNGSFRSMFCAGGKNFAIVQRLINDVEVWWLEEFDEDLLIDGAVAFTAPSVTLADYPSTELDVISETTWFHGLYTTSAGGVLTTFDLDDGAYVAGLHANVDVSPLPPKIQHPAFRHGQRYGIPQVLIHVKDTGSYTLNSQLSPAYRTGEALDIAPPLRTEAKKFKVPGRGDTLVPIIAQCAPAPLIVLSLMMEVDF